MKYITLILFYFFIISCNHTEPVPETTEENSEIYIKLPQYFPKTNQHYLINKPTKYGVKLGEKLFNDKRLSTDNSISCSSCHIKSHAFSDTNPRAKGIKGRIGIRNVPPLQNLAFMNFYLWDGNHIALENQVLVPIITKEEMGSNILEVISKIKDDNLYKSLFTKTFGDDKITGDRIYKSIAQYEYTLISANSKYDRIQQGVTEEKFTPQEANGFEIFKEKCASCHSTELFTDQTFRNIGFPVIDDVNEAGRARVTGNPKDYMAFRVPSLRNIEYTAPYGSFGQFKTLKDVLDYFDNGVLNSENLDPILKENNGKIPLNKTEKNNLIAFLKTLSDPNFTTKK